ncbi:MAG: hypothetical protein WAL98_20150 [Desulfatiglandaceae bacterium]
MKTKSILSFLILIGIAAFLGPVCIAWAEAPAIHIDLNFDSSFYGYGDPVGVDIAVTNESGKDILISQGFRSIVYYMEMRVIDPAGNLLLARHDEFHDEFPDAPPVPFILYEGRVIRAASCEVLPAGWEGMSQTADIRDFYEMVLPGYYSAQVQLSAMVFKGEPGDPCDINDYEWLGVLKSETRYFYVEGTTEVNILPKRWRIVWQNGRYVFPNVKVAIWPEEGKTVGDYQLEGIKLNNVEANKVRKLYSFWKKKYYLLAFFNKQEAVNSLGDVTVGQKYPARISGQLTSGEYFGGSRQIKIVR